jgi:hypothetical protein
MGRLLAFLILRPGRPLSRAAHHRAWYGPAWSAHFSFYFSVVVSFSFLFLAIFTISVLIKKNQILKIYILKFVWILKFVQISKIV